MGCFTISVDSDKLLLARPAKYLGLWVRNDLSWDDQILNICRKKHYRFHMFRRLMKFHPSPYFLTRRGRATYICVSKLILIGSDNGLSPGRHQAIIWTNAGVLLIGPLGINFSEILIKIKTFSFKKMHLEMSSAKWRLFRLDLNELTYEGSTYDPK